MRERAVGGYEPDENEQRELVELWHISRTALAGRKFDGKNEERSARISWIVDEFLKAHTGEPNIARKWIYVWVVDNIGPLTRR